jgi:hypothetical protein
MGVFDDFHRLLIFHSYPNKKKIKEYVNRNSGDYLSNKNTNSIFSSLGCKCIAEINYEIFSIKPKAYSYLISFSIIFFLIIYDIVQIRIPFPD